MQVFLGVSGRVERGWGAHLQHGAIVLGVGGHADLQRHGLNQDREGAIQCLQSAVQVMTIREGRRGGGGAWLGATWSRHNSVKSRSASRSSSTHLLQACASQATC